MPNVKLKFQGGERIVSGTVSIGRTPDNTISFPDDPNISRNHAEIEQRGDYYCLIDLGSSNGTTVSGQPVTGELYLWDGAEILLGGSAKLEVVFINADGSEPERPAAVADEQDTGHEAPESPAPAEQVAAPPAGSKKMLIAAGGIFGLAVVFGAGAVAVYVSRSSTCEAKATIVSPEQGDTIIGAKEVEVEVENNGCVERAIFAIDGIEFASSDSSPYTATIDPKEYPEFSDGYDHGLTVILEDAEGNRLPQSEPVLLAFETRAVAKPTPGPTIAQNTNQQQAAPQTQGSVSLIDIHEMSKRLIAQYPANASYNVSNRQFLVEVQKRTAEYAQEGYFDRAAKYRDPINIAFVREQNLDAPLGFMLAMSRSKFVPDKQGMDEGLWRMTDEFATANGYKGLCGTETLLDPTQNCAAKATALYMKAMVLGVFQGDVIYSVAAFGRSTQDAGTWKATLPPNRSDIWNVIKTPAEREQVIRFFAAGIVAENPQKFGLKRDRPISELYRLAM